MFVGCTATASIVLVLLYICISPTTQEYKQVMPAILTIVEKHQAALVKGAPQLNYCDVSVMVSFASWLLREVFAITQRSVRLQTIGCNLYVLASMLCYYCYPQIMVNTRDGTHRRHIKRCACFRTGHPQDVKSLAAV